MPHLLDIIAAAQRVLDLHLSNEVAKTGDSLVVVASSVVEKDDGWLVHYQSKRFVDTGEFGSQLAGNLPLFVRKVDGAIYATKRTKDPVTGSWWNIQPDYGRQFTTGKLDHRN